MKRPMVYLIFIPVLFLLSGCKSSTSPISTGGDGGNNTNNNGWLVKSSEVIDGGPGKDGIPSIDNPKFIPVSQEIHLDSTSVVLGVKIGDTLRAYPLQIMDWHEIVNDKINGTKFSLTYCPLTGSGIAWNRTIDGQTTTFGTSGLLYRNNLVAYDRQTGTLWSQMLEEGIHGDNISKHAKMFQVLRTNWYTWKKAYPNSEVLSRETGYGRNYDLYPYGDYRTNNTYFLFPVIHQDNHLPAKTIIYGVELTPNNHIAYPASIIIKPGANPVSIMSKKGVTVINDSHNGLVIAGSQKFNFTVAFGIPDNIDTGNFTAIQNALPVVMQDQKGNKYNWFSEVTEGPDKGMKLKYVKSYSAYWFAWADFFPKTAIYVP
ncbi:MAG TPA: DUF3179 domain-containing protein [Balneolales bacterium]|nr:DUF3179 domain-containing protein [Balneolales bacterium]